MRAKHVLWVALALSVAWLPMRGGAFQASDVKADYDRANSLNQRVANKVVRRGRGARTG